MNKDKQSYNHANGGLSYNKQSCEIDKYQTIKVLSIICEGESCWSEQTIRRSFKAIKHVKIANQTSMQTKSPCLKKMRYPLIDQLNVTFSSTSVQAWSLKFPMESPICGLVFFTCVPTRWTRLAFISWKNYYFWKSQSRHLFCFYFKGKK